MRRSGRRRLKVVPVFTSSQRVVRDIMSEPQKKVSDMETSQVDCILAVQAQSNRTAQYVTLSLTRSQFWFWSTQKHPRHLFLHFYPPIYLHLKKRLPCKGTWLLHKCKGSRKEEGKCESLWIIVHLHEVTQFNTTFRIRYNATGSCFFL